MFIFKATADLSRTNEEFETIYDDFANVTGAYFNNGQVMADGEPVYFAGETLVWVTQTLEKTSFARKNDSCYVRRFREKFEKRFESKLKFELQGENPCEANACQCKAPSKYVLFTNYVKLGSPLVCADCGYDVPLYRIPKPPLPPRNERPKYPEERDYYAILGWERRYQNCDSLQMACGLGERWATRQMSDFHSELTREGREIAAKIEERTGVPTFYYLYDYRHVSHVQNLREACPACGKTWTHVPEAERCFDLWCDACRLVKNLTFNPR